jgi:hypothetical protein
MIKRNKIDSILPSILGEVCGMCGGNNFFSLSFFCSTGFNSPKKMKSFSFNCIVRHKKREREKLFFAKKKKERKDGKMNKTTSKNGRENKKKKK